MTALVITGTGTEVGKTIVTAAIASLAAREGRRVAVVKPAQTGLGAATESDVEIVARLADIDDVHGLARYPEPLAPATAARRAGMVTLDVSEAGAAIHRLADRDLVLVEGAGGVLVRLDDKGGTILDIARQIDADVLVVAAAGLGTLNATALTCRAIRDHRLRCLGVVVGAWPAEPDLAASCNLEDLPSYADAPLLGVLPEGMSRLAREEFARVAAAHLRADLGGDWQSYPSPPV